MSVEQKVTFASIKGFQEAVSYQVCSKFFYTEDTLIKLKLLIFDLDSEAAFKAWLSGHSLSENEDIVTKAFSTSNEDSFMLAIDLSLLTMALTFQGETVIKNVPLRVENFIDLRRTMFELAVDDTDAKVAKLATVLQRQKELQCEVEDLRKSLKQVVDEKLKLEKSMLGKFLPILKAKEDRLVELERACRDLATKLHPVSPSSSSSADDESNSAGTTADAETSLSIL